MYIETMKNMLQKILVEIHKLLSHKGKLQSLLHAIGRYLYMNKLNKNLRPLRKLKLSKKVQEKEDEIKRNLQKANQNWNSWKFQIHWNKLE